MEPDKLPTASFARRRRCVERGPYGPRSHMKQRLLEGAFCGKSGSQFENYERSFDLLRTRPRIIGRGSRSSLEIRGLGENVMSLRVERHGAGAELRRDVSNRAVFIGRILVDNGKQPLPANSK